VISAHRIFGLLAVCLIFVVSGSAVAHADDPSMSVEVERGESKKIDVMANRSAPVDAKLVAVTPIENDYGKATPSPDGKSITYEAKNRTGETLLVYKGRDAVNGVDYNGTIKISVVPMQRIVTFDAMRVAGVLGVILVLAIILEIGLSTLFNWKFFQENLLGKGLRTPIAVAVSAFFVFHYKLDTVSDLLSAFTGDPESSFGKTTAGQIITAFVVAGGSSTVYELFRKLGIRTPFQPPAQIVIDLVRQNVPSTALVNVTIDGKLAATVEANRFPITGAYSLSAGTHEIGLEARDATGAVKTVKQAVNLDAGAEVKVAITI
jgi:hypothetical protein